MEHAHHHEALLRELALVTKELESLGVHDPENPQNWVATPVGTGEGESDENVAADRAEELEERESILADLENRYNATRAALARLDAGTYGTCEICGSAIEENRLAANPAARTCIAHREEEVGLT